MSFYNEGALDKKQFVQKKFSRITRFYDLLNTILSLGIDHFWRWVTAKRLEDAGGIVLDLCAGTLPMSNALFKHSNFRGRILAIDFCLEMLKYGKERCFHPHLSLVCGDALQLPLKDKSIDAIVVAFGVRNFSDYLAGLKEMHRVLKPKGKAVILEFSRPTHPVFSAIYFAYLNYILPKIGGIISGDEMAYTYLSKSIQEFYTPKQWLEIMGQAGFENLRYRYLTLGIVSIYEGTRV